MTTIIFSKEQRKRMKEAGFTRKDINWFKTMWEQDIGDRVNEKIKEYGDDQ